MYRELLPLRQALSLELKANLPPAVPGIDSEHLLQSYLDRLAMYVGCDVADQILTFFAVDTAGEELGHLSTPNVSSPCAATRSPVPSGESRSGNAFTTSSTTSPLARNANPTSTRRATG
jgi:hypothetical protein